MQLSPPLPLVSTTEVMHDCISMPNKHLQKYKTIDEQSYLVMLKAIVKQFQPAVLRHSQNELESSQANRAWNITRSILNILFSQYMTGQCQRTPSNSLDTNLYKTTYFHTSEI